MKVLVTGANGQLGYDIVKILNLNNIYCTGIDKNNLDLTDEIAVNKFFDEHLFNVIIHCAAYTAVDKAETENSLCYEANVNATKYLTNNAKKQHAKIIYISTDYVFDGTLSLNKMYKETDLVNPVNYYGYTKELGEKIVRDYKNHCILRISWVFGVNGNNFIKTMLNLAKNRDEIGVINDQFGSPTYTVDLAQKIPLLIMGDFRGTYHMTNDGYTTWYEFAKYIFKVIGNDVKLNKITTKDYPTTAKRPNNSQLDKTKFNEKLSLMPRWEDAVNRYLKELEVLK